jgi:N-methylhydantoinase A
MTSGRNLKIGVDVGGTFTDIVGIDENGLIFFAKTPSIPEDQSIGVVNGIRRILADLNLTPESVKAVAHGTTVATNTLLERNGAVTALITTEGFRDVLYIGRQNRLQLYDLHARKPDPLVPRYLRREVSERTLYTGVILVQLEEEGLRKIVRELIDDGVQSLAVCFLHSYANATNEQRALQVIREEAPKLLVSVSSEILPEFREFERMNTTVINAYVQPRMAKYISRLIMHINQAGVKAPLTIMKSSGGTMTDMVAASQCVNTLLSGPAGGVLGAQVLANITEYKNMITADMGGTSFDVSIIQNGQVAISNEGTIAGYDVRFPHLDITTIGAGGGSIAWIDTGGALRVGPQSAGAIPGPVCYSKGGVEPTVTDANAILGYVGNALLGGELKLDIERARNAIKARLADPLKMGIEEVAEGIIKVANANMVRAIRKMTVERGIDPRNFVILPFGGAGPLHAVELARALEVERVVIPIAPGNFSALGLLAAPIRYDEVVTHRVHQNEVDLEKIESLMKGLEEQANNEMMRDGVDPAAVAFERLADVRYFGQAYSLTIPFPNEPVSQEVWDKLIVSFHESHERAYGFRNENDPIEVVSLRMAAVGVNDNSNLYAEGEKAINEVLPIKISPAYFNGEWVDTTFYNRADLKVGHTFQGPAVIIEQGATTVLGPGDRATVDSRMSIVITVATYKMSKTGKL